MANVVGVGNAFFDGIGILELAAVTDEDTGVCGALGAESITACVAAGGCGGEAGATKLACTATPPVEPSVSAMG
jgi:hypothetical protein